MEIPVKVSLLFDRDRGLEIEIECETSSTEFVEVTIKPEDVCALMSRQVKIPGIAKIRGLETIGKKMEVDSMSFEFDRSKFEYSEIKKHAYKRAIEVCPDGWKPDSYFGSQGSFFTEDGIGMARCTIRRYLDVEG